MFKCVQGEISWRKHSRRPPILQIISERVAMQRDWEEHIWGSVEQETCVEELARISRKETPEVKKEEARQ
jgi:hypothetical protein